MRLQAYEVVYQTMEKGEHSDSIFHRIVEQNDFLTRDKRFLKRLSYGTIERSVELDAICKDSGLKNDSTGSHGSSHGTL